MQDVIRMTYDVALCHPDELTKIWFLSHPAIPSISSGWLIVDALCHPDDLPGVGISSGRVTANSLCHPDDTLFHFMSSGWLNGGWFLIRMSYFNVIMSSGWDTLPFVSHPDEIANFDFPQHAVALQRFRSLATVLSHYGNQCTGKVVFLYRRSLNRVISITRFQFEYHMNSITIRCDKMDFTCIETGQFKTFNWLRPSDAYMCQ